MKALECVHKLSVFSVTDPAPPTSKKDTVMVKFLDEKQITFLEKAKEEKGGEQTKCFSFSVAFKQRSVGGCQNIFCPPEFSIH